MGSSQPAPPVRIVLADEDEMAQPRISNTEPPTRAPSLLRGAWSVQVGAYNSADQARDQLDRVTAYSLTLNEAQPAARSVDINGSRLWRARFESLTEDEARQACEDLEARREACFAVAPGR